MPKVIIVINCYNQGQYIDEVVESVLNQTFQDFEIIIVNNGSTDEFTNDLLRSYNKPKTKVIYNNEQELDLYKNRSIKEAKGNYIIPLSIYNKVKKEYLEELVKILDINIGKYYSLILDKDVHIKNIEYELNMIEQSKAWRLSEFLRRLIYCRLLYNIPLFQRILFSIQREGLTKSISNKILVHLGLRASDYDRWIKINKLTEEKIKKIKTEIAGFQYNPKISIIMPVFNVDEIWLVKAIESVLNQLYKNWDLCIVDDGSTEKHVKRVLARYAEQDKRILVKYLPKNSGIARTSNEAFSLTTGEFIGLIDNDDELSADALYEVVKVLNKRREIDFVYSDEDKITVEGIRRDPFFKPDWSPDTFRSYNYICHFAVIRRKILENIGGFREGYEGSQDYDLFLRVTETTQKIEHIPKILYHWRCIDSSVGKNAEAKMYAYDSAKRALSDHIQRLGLDGDVRNGHSIGTYHIKYEINDYPKVSIIIPTKDKVKMLRRCIDSISRLTCYENYSIFVVDNGSLETETNTYYNYLKNNPKVSIIKYDIPFNFSSINNYAVNRIDSEYLVFMNNDTEVISKDWIEEMLGFAQREDVGVVGTLLYYPNNTVQHAGVIIGIGGVAGHSHKYISKDSLGYYCRLKVIQNLSAVTAACMMTKKSLFKGVGGFDENLSYAFNDVDYCLKVREKGYLIVYTPYAELYHYESKSRGYEDNFKKQVRFRKETDYFSEKWNDLLADGDPFYNPNLTLSKEDFSIKT